MGRLTSVGNYGNATFPTAVNFDSGTALTNNTAYSSSTWGATQQVRLLKVMRLDPMTTADVITIIDKTSTSTGIVLTTTALATGVPYTWDFGPHGVPITGGFGITISSGGTAGRYVYFFDAAAPSA